MKKSFMSILCGIGAILVTIIMYFIILGNIFTEIICFVTLMGVILAELIVTLLAHFSNGTPGKVSCAIVAGIMIPISIILSAVYIVNFPYGYGSYLGLYFAILIVLMIIITIIWNFSNVIKERDAGFQNSKQHMINMRKLVKCIMLEPKAEKYHRELNDIEEKLHFTNDSVTPEIDSEISDMLSDLLNNINNEEYNVEESIRSITKKVDFRNIMLNKTV